MKVGFKVSIFFCNVFATLIYELQEDKPTQNWELLHMQKLKSSFSIVKDIYEIPRST